MLFSVSNIVLTKTVDYILIIKRDVNVTPNFNEIETYRFVTQSELKDMVSDPSISLTPWYVTIALHGINVQ